jgi:hypothetical protein
VNKEKGVEYAKITNAPNEKGSAKTEKCSMSGDVILNPHP